MTDDRWRDNYDDDPELDCDHSEYEVDWEGRATWVEALLDNMITDRVFERDQTKGRASPAYLVRVAAEIDALARVLVLIRRQFHQKATGGEQRGEAKE